MTNKQYIKWFIKLNLFDKELLYNYWKENIDEIY